MTQFQFQLRSLQVRGSTKNGIRLTKFQCSTTQLDMSRPEDGEVYNVNRNPFCEHYEYLQ